MVQHAIQDTDVNTTDTTTFVRITDNQREALRSCESGPSAPANPVQGMKWLDTADADAPVLKRYTGTAWVAEAVIDVANGRIRKMLDADADTYIVPTGTDGEVALWCGGALSLTVGPNGIRYGTSSSTLAWDMGARTGTAMRLPSGTTLQRPSPAGDGGKGLLRHNETLARNEQTVEGAWGNVPVTTEVAGYSQSAELRNTDGVFGVTQFAFTGIPASTQVIRVMLDETWRPGGYVAAQLGDAGGYEETGYDNPDFTITNINDNTNDDTKALFLGGEVPPNSGSRIAGGVIRGAATLWRTGGNTWTLETGWAVYHTAGQSNYYLLPWNAGATKTLSSPLDRLRLLFRNGSHSTRANQGRLGVGNYTGTSGGFSLLYA